MTIIKDETYIRLAKDKAEGVSLTDPELVYVRKMEELQHMSDFRPDWFSPQYKQKKIDGLYADLMNDLKET